VHVNDVTRRLPTGHHAEVDTDLHMSLAVLEEGLDEIRRSPRDEGRVDLVIRTPAVDEREILAEAELDPERGLLGDDWWGPGAETGRQVTLMNSRAAALVAQTPERWALAGDQLYVDFDLSVENLPAGTRLMVGSAVLEATGVPHRGCTKFMARFGRDALKFVNSDQGYALNLRGINVRVVSPGTVRPGDVIRKLP
jgi:MOSC domain-containing protein YiiM